jgi:exosortase
VGLENGAEPGTLRANVNPQDAPNQSGMNATSSRGVAAGCALIGFLVFQFWGNSVRGYIDTSSVFWWWGWQWFNPASEAQHGLLVLGVAGWLAWRNLRESKIAPSPADSRIAPAVTAMLVGLAIHLLGYAVQQTRISIVAVLMFAWGVARLGGGRRWSDALGFPLGLLVFAIPLGVLDAVGFHLRLGVIATTEVIAQLAGIEVVRNGTQLFSPDGSYQYDVASACSGVRSLMAMLALSAIVAYLGPRSIGRRLVVFLLAFPLTFVGNVVRISSIVFAGEWFGQRAGEILHDWAGFIVFVIVLGGVHWAAQRLETREPGPPSNPRPEATRPTQSNHNGYLMRRRSRRVAGLVVGLAALGTVAVIGRLDALGHQAQAGIMLAADGLNPAPLPKFIGTDWIGQETAVTAVEREMLPPDTGFARRLYVSLDDRREQVFVSVVLSGQDRTSIHRPELCLVGQGWSIEGQQRMDFGPTMPATLLQLERERVGPTGERAAVPALFAYWFVGRDRIVPTTFERLGWTAVNRLRLQPDRWAYVVVQTVILPGESEAESRARMARVVAPLRAQLVPE